MSEERKKIVGVNLGNWLVLEKWMQPFLFGGKLRGGRGLAKPQGSGKKAASADEKTQGYLYRRSGFC